ncbi:MAG: hypothetical protein HYS80_01990 [Candidatus Aenigmarchaeota archaeon]|nr:hypothetical protein [Candidatus Aenigmarchaeota archaeon]
MTEHGHGGHHFKLVLALLLIVGIMGLIAYANTGQKFLEAFKVGKFADVQPSTQTESFGMVLSTGVTALYGKSFSIAGSPFSFEGVCNFMKVGGLIIETEETRCSASAEGFTGTFQYSPFGSIVFVGSANAVKVNANKYSAATPISFEFEVIPTGFSVAGINVNSISMVAQSGDIEKYGKDGSLKAVAYLSQSTLDINSLIASAQLEKGELKISGIATSVKSEEFSW